MGGRHLEPRVGEDRGGAPVRIYGTLAVYPQYTCARCGVQKHGGHTLARLEWATPEQLTAVVDKVGNPEHARPAGWLAVGGGVFRCRRCRTTPDT